MGKCILAGHPPIGEEGVELPLVLDAALSQTPDGTTWELPKNFFGYSEIVVVGSFNFQNSGYSPKFCPGDDTDYYIVICGGIDGYKTVIAIIRPRHCGAALFYEQQQYTSSGLGGKIFPNVSSLIAEKTPLCYGLSGTPIYNRGGEMWSVMNIIEYHCLGDYDSFTREWCYGYGNDVVKNPDQLGSYLKREGLMLRRRKSEVLKELPPKRRVVQTVDFDSGTYGKLIQDAVDKAQSIDGIKDYFEKGRLTRDIIDDSRRAIGIAKAPYVAAFIKMLLDSGERVLLGAYHHDVWDIYQKELKDYNPVFITGRETAAQKDESVEAFKSGATNLCCISLRAAAGIDGLQSATCVACGELDWSPAIHSQFEDRVQRIGVNTEQDSILCYYLVAEEGTDEAIQEFLGLKVSQFSGIMGDKSETEEDKALAQAVATEHMKKVIEKLKAKGMVKEEVSA